MAKNTSSSILLAIFLAFILVANTGTMKGVDGALCEKPSLTWSGNCKNTQNCDKQCKEWEGAKHGACHKRGNWKCFCYRDC